MKKFLLYIFTLILFIGLFIPTNFVNAATNYDKCMSVEANQNLCSSSSNPYGPPNATYNGTIYTDSGGEAQPSTDSGCGILNPLACIMPALAMVAYLVLGLFSLLLWLAGHLLEEVLKITIINFSSNIEGMHGINIAWRTVRDLVNMLFIFILVYEGIKIIISRSSVSNAGKIISGIVITAILINFSVFFTKIIIDASNITTIGFYTSIQNANGNNSNGNIPTGISGAYANALKITEFFKPESLSNFKTEKNGDDKSLVIVGIMGSILFLILSFVFISMSALFLIRYIVLIVLLMFSPFGFIGWGIPKLQGLQSRWWTTLTGQALFGPIFMILTWINLTLLSNGGFTGLDNMSYTGLVLKGDSSSIGLIINFAIIISLTILSLTLSKGYANRGSELIGDLTNRLTSFTGGAVLGGTASLGRNTVGRIGDKLSQNETLKRRAAEGGVAGFFAKQGLKAADRTAKSTFDARNSSSVAWAAGQAKLDLGKADKRDFRKVLDEKAKKEAEFAKLLKPSDKKSAEADIYKKQAEESTNNADQIKDQLKDETFVETQNREKTKYLNSQDYKNTDVYKKAEQQKNANDAKEKAEKDKASALDAELAQLEKEKKESFNLAKQKEIDEKIVQKKKEIEEQNKRIADVKREIEANNEFIKAREKYEKEWKTDAQLKLEAREKEYRTEAENFVKQQKEIEDLYKTRVNQYANNQKSIGWLRKYTQAVTDRSSSDLLNKSVEFGISGVETVLTGMKTKDDREYIAKKIKEVTGKKKKLSKEERKKKMKERKEAEEAGDLEKIKKINDELDKDEDD